MHQHIVTIAVFLLIVIGFNNEKKEVATQKKSGVIPHKIVKNIPKENLNQPDLSDYTLFFEDDFDSTALNTNIWDYRQEGVASRDSSINLRQNAHIKNGNLYLITDRHKNGFSGVNISTESKSKAYHFKYGYFEISARLPQSVGNVGAFWMQAAGMAKTYQVPNPSIYGTEIDILEYSASNLDNLFHSLHWNGYDYSRGAKVETFKNLQPGISKGYHIIALEWTPKEYIIYVDNVEIVRSDKNISRSPEFLILGCGTGGFGGTYRPGPWPDTMAVDYIKVYKRKPEVRLYELCDGYGHISDGLPAGSFTTKQLTAVGVLNNSANSCEVPKGWKLTAFDGDNFTGKSVVITNDTRCLGSLNFANKLSSLKIEEN